MREKGAKLREFSHTLRQLYVAQGPPSFAMRNNSRFNRGGRNPLSPDRFACDEIDGRKSRRRLTSFLKTARFWRDFRTVASAILAAPLTLGRSARTTRPEKMKARC